MFLQQLNPSLKALTIMVFIIFLATIFEPITPLLFLIWTVLITFLFGKVSWKKYLLYFSPFFIFALGMLWTSIAFADPPINPDEAINILSWSLPTENVLTALALALRVLNVAALSLLFVFTTNIVHFILSMMQQLKLPPRIAYAVLAGYRFLPMIRDELKIIHDAHLIRGVNQAKTPKEKMQNYKRYAIPLLASAIRKAERTAIAMESKGFTGDKNRSFYRQFTIGKLDFIFPLIMLIGFATAFFVSKQLGF
ncbi:energy-coupling factor transporter transmembrane protein EcfT [Oceanobacillus piezotolerans]|uniref:Energy-coupling factor transporter transmembrane protein EcfT n=1 Tax=Oceanobacillus piezotolerans TaxID=2448030 RepID=A0A498D4R7_9BACI|nr:energy-coupling factor transporter transmembrane component T [Oceanobacillus piezotolerans]RLL43593.1 energy-coupling factor transporter transmembrane protein EcfT [Oceanobacillus piezotolerans]